MKIDLNVEILTRLAEGLVDLENQESDAFRLATNRTLDWLYTRVVRRVAEETGMQQKRVRMVIRKVPAGNRSPVAALVSKDIYTSLKDFRPHQTKKGVVASPWGKSHLFPHTFIGPGGHVYKRRRAGGIRKLFGPLVPKEMIKETVSGPLLEEAVREQFPVHLEFFTNRAIDRTKLRFHL